MNEIKDLIRSHRLRVRVDGNTLRIAPWPIPEDVRELLVQAKPALIQIPDELRQAIAALCSIRGDTDRQRDALLSECQALTVDRQADLLDYFNDEFRRVLSIVYLTDDDRRAVIDRLIGRTPA